MNRPLPRRALPAFVLLLVWAGTARAQVEFRCTFPATQLLQYEPLLAVVTLRNDGTAPMRAGGPDPYILSFELTDASGVVIHQKDHELPWVPTVIDPQTEVTFTNDLQHLYRVYRNESLGVRAHLAVAGRSYATPKTFIDIVPGAEVARLDAVAPDGSPRTYSLRTLNRDKRDRLFLRIDNEHASLCYGVIDLGRFVRVGTPTLQTDTQGRVHVLHLSAPGRFTYSVFTSDGGLVSHEVVSGDTSSVRLEPDGHGSFHVVGVGASPTPTEPIVEPLPMRRSL